MKRLHDISCGLGVVVFGLFGYNAVHKIFHSDYPIYYLILSAFFALMAGIYLFRKPATDSASDWREWIIPLAVTFGPMISFSFVEPGGKTLHLGYSIAAIGMALAVWGLIHLRLNFSLFVEARQCVTSGPYRIVRHPLYAGEVIAFIGLAFSAPSWITWSTVALLVVGQLYRAWMEEGKLLRHFGDQYRELQQESWWPLTRPAEQ